MEKTGLLNNLAGALNENVKSFVLKETSPEARSYHESLQDTLNFLKRIKNQQNPELILAAEKAILKHELKHHANAPEMVRSLQTAHEQLLEAVEALKLVRIPSSYQALNQGMSSKDKQQGLPLDAFRKFERSHRARLGNLLKATASNWEKELLRQRMENLTAIRERYIQLQHHALDLEP